MGGARPRPARPPWRLGPHTLARTPAGRLSKAAPSAARPQRQVERDLLSALFAPARLCGRGRVAAHPARPPGPISGHGAALAIGGSRPKFAEENREKFTPKRPKTPTLRPAQWLHPVQLPSETSLSNAAAHPGPLPPLWARFPAVLGRFGAFRLRSSRRLLSGAIQASRCGRYPAVTRPLPSRYLAVT